MIMLDYFDSAQPQGEKPIPYDPRTKSEPIMKLIESTALIKKQNERAMSLTLSNQPEKSAESNRESEMAWELLLNDEKIPEDASSFREWNKEITDADPAIEKDLTRTRTDHPRMRDPATQQALREIAAFFCFSNKIEYQQGHLELIAPFLLSKKEFDTSLCYACFSSFMRKCYSNFLIASNITESPQLPYLNAALEFCDLMVQYHIPKVSEVLRTRGIDCRAFALSWIITLFAKGTPISVVYRTFEYYLQREDKQFFFYLIVAMLAMSSKDLMKLSWDDDSDNTQLIKYLNHHIKADTLRDADCVKYWFELADKIKKNTPKSFETHFINLSFQTGAIDNLEVALPYVYPAEIINFILKKTKKISLRPLARDIQFVILDLRRKKEHGYVPCTVDLPTSIYKSGDVVVKELLKGQCRSSKDVHFCLMMTGDGDEQENKMGKVVCEELMKSEKNHVSLLFGGFKGLIEEIAKRKGEIDLRKKEKNFFQKFKRVFGH